MIAAIVVWYNPSVEEIAHVNDYINDVEEVVIMDNSKNNNFCSIKKYIKNYNKIVYRHYVQNVGLCVALNDGLKLINDSGYKWALIMDSDSSFITNIVAVYKKYIQKDNTLDIAVLSPVHVFDRSKEKPFFGVKNLKWAMTSGCLYNLEIFNIIGGFKQELFVDGLDIDYCYRARKNGYKIIEFSEAKLNHHPGDTKTINLLNRYEFKYGIASPWRYYMQARAIVWLILKYHYVEDVFRYIYKWLKILFLFDNKKKYINEMLKGSIEGVDLWKKDKKKH